jgi:hypothetical protein
MMAGAGRLLAWGLCLISIVLMAFLAVLSLANGSGAISTEWGTPYNLLAYLASALAVPIVGALVASRRPENAVGWLCLAIGVFIAASGLATQYGIYSLTTKPDSLPWGPEVAWFGNWSWILYVVPIGVFLVLLFPNGHLPSRRWRTVLWAGVASMVAGGLAEALYPGVLDVTANGIRNPFGVENAHTFFAVLDATTAILPLCLLAAGASMVVRFRRSRGEERQQLKWFVYAAVVLATLFAVEMTMVGLTGVTGRGLGQQVIEDLVTLGLGGPPIAAGIAILRYRLYDIDVIVNRTLVYTALTATLALVYMAGVVGIGGMVREVTGQQNNNLVVAASTLAVAALFRPARARIQGLIDRIFYRSKYDARRTLEDFSTRLRDEVSLDALTSDLLITVKDTMKPARISLWLRH